MTKPLIAIDIDDVLADFTGIVRRHVNDQTGLNLSDEDYRISADYWGYYERVWAAHPEAQGQSINPVIEEMAIDQGHVPLLAGAAFGITELAKHFKLVCITARSEVLRSSTFVWLDQHFSDNDLEVHFTNHTRKEEPTITKGEIARGLGVSYLIDDNVEHCVSALEHGVTPVLFGEYGWQHTVPKGMARARDWPAVVEYFAGEA